MFRQLDNSSPPPTNQDAEEHREATDEVYELAERMYEEVDRRRGAQEEFEALFKARYLN